jgi:hypothetical protein
VTAAATLAPRPRADGTEPCLADGVDPDLFFPHDEDADLEAAAALCRKCPRTAECLAWAIEAREPGIWAATTTAQREQLRAEHGITTRLPRLTSKDIATMTTALKPSPAAYAPGTEAAVTAELARQNDTEAEADITAGAVAGDVPVQPKTDPAPVAERAAAHRHGVTGAEPPSVADVIAAARATGDAKLTAQADKTESAVDALVAMFGEHQALAAAQKDVAWLEAQLAAAKAKVRDIKHGKTAPKTQTAATDNPAARRRTVDHKAVRAWAAANNIECSTLGRVQGAVIDAYFAAMDAQGVTA